MKKKEQFTYAIIKIESYTGEETYLSCGRVEDFRLPFDELDDEAHLYAVVSIDQFNQAEIVDCGYTTFDEAVEHWPQAKPMRTDSQHEELSADL